MFCAGLSNYLSLHLNMLDVSLIVPFAAKIIFIVFFVRLGTLGNHLNRRMPLWNFIRFLV